MAEVKKSEGISGPRKLALTIIIGVFVAVMLVTLVNLIVSYAYPAPEWEKFCSGNQFDSAYPEKIYPNTNCNLVNCSFNLTLMNLGENCSSQGGQPIYGYDANGCAISLKSCNLCNKGFENSMKTYNRQSFFIFALVGFAILVFGLFKHVLLLQIISLPAGAVLVIQAAMKNFDSKLMVIIVFSLLIIAAIYLALKKLR